MAAQLTAEEQVIRQTGMQVFGLESLREQVVNELKSAYRQVRNSLSSWRVQLQRIVSDGDTDGLSVFAVQLKEQGVRIRTGRFSRVVLPDATTKAAIEAASGYPAGFIDVAYKVIDDALEQMAAFSKDTTVEELQAFFAEVEAEMTEEPSL